MKVQQVFYKTAKFCGSEILLNAFNNFPRNTIFPFYHSVSDTELLHLKHLYPVRTSSQFERDLDFLLSRFEICVPEDILQGKKFKKPAFLLSFDDGLREFFDIVAPILLKKGIPAICFLNTDFIDNRNLFYRFKVSLLIENILKQKSADAKVKEWFIRSNLSISNPKSLLDVSYSKRAIIDELAGLLGLKFDEYLKSQKPYMTTERILDLSEKGFYFGAHSIDHPLFNEIAEFEQLRQAKESIEFVCKSFNQRLRLFSFPFTDYGVSRSFFKSAHDTESGFADITFGCAGMKDDECDFHIQRIPAETGSFELRSIIAGESMAYFLKKLTGRNIASR